MALADAANALHTDKLPAVGDVLADEQQLEAWLADEQSNVAQDKFKLNFRAQPARATLRRRKEKGETLNPVLHPVGTSQGLSEIISVPRFRGKAN
ncbi:hypothetical protein B0H13DRAFT_2337799 [Mycena leptocephala]|nr:hypothetical protein B0H13DRAFT_2337799 [Mycena leptocephala]